MGGHTSTGLTKKTGAGRKAVQPSSSAWTQNLTNALYRGNRGFREAPGEDDTEHNAGLTDAQLAAQTAEASRKKAEEKKAKERSNRIATMKTKYEKFKKTPQGQNSVFDEDVVGNDIDRWTRHFENQKNHPEQYQEKIKPLDQYKHPDELHEAMKSLKTKREEELEKQDIAEQGTKTVFADNNYKVYEASNPQALSKLAQGSHWCVQAVGTADQYMNQLKHGNFHVIYKDGKPLAAITHNPENEQDEVWFHTDFDLRTGQSYAPDHLEKAIILKEDFDYINSVMRRLGKPKLTDEHADVFESKEKLNQYIKDTFDNPDDSEMAERKRQQVLLAIRDRFEPEIEKKVAENDNWALLHAAALVDRIPEVEERFSKDGNLAVRYALAIRRPFPEPYRKQAEEEIIRSRNIGDYVRATNGRVESFERGAIEGRYTPRDVRNYLSDIHDVLKIRIPEMEKLLLTNARLAQQHATLTLRAPWPEAEDIIKTNPQAAVNYAEDALHKPWPEAEDIIKTDPNAASDYAVRVMKKEWPEAEEIIKTHPNALVNYLAAFAPKGQRVSGDLEKVLLREMDAALKYVKTISKQPWPELENMLVEASRDPDFPQNIIPSYLADAIQPGQRASKELEKRLDPISLALYATNKVQERIPDMEEVIGTEPEPSFIYISKFFPHGERAPASLENGILSHPRQLLYYLKNHIGKPVPELEPFFGSESDLAFRYVEEVLPPGQRATKALETTLARTPGLAIKYSLRAKQRIPELEKEFIKIGEINNATLSKNISDYILAFAQKGQRFTPEFEKLLTTLQRKNATQANRDNITLYSRLTGHDL